MSSPSKALHAELTRSKDFWLDDGNVVLVARGETVAFRAHKSILSRHSPYFRNYFAKHTDAEKSLSDCYIVHLTDKPNDLLNFLRVIYDGRKYVFTFSPAVIEGPVDSSSFSYFRKEDNIALDVTISVANVMDKYKVKDVKTDAMQRLKTIYTSKFAQWEHNIAVLHEQPSLSPCNPSILFSVVNLAHRTKEVSLLPAALYLCCQLDPKLLLGGKNGNQLQVQDQIRCMNGKARLADARLALLHYIWEQTTDRACTQRLRCRQALQIRRRRLDLSEAIRTTEPCFALFSSCREDILATGLCKPCTKALLKKHAHARRYHWAKLPSYMGVNVPGWMSVPDDDEVSD